FWTDLRVLICCLHDWRGGGPVSNGVLLRPLALVCSNVYHFRVCALVGMYHLFILGTVPVSTRGANDGWRRKKNTFGTFFTDDWRCGKAVDCKRGRVPCLEENPLCSGDCAIVFRGGTKNEAAHLGQVSYGPG